MLYEKGYQINNKKKRQNSIKNIKKSEDVMYLLKIETEKGDAV